MQSNKRCSLYKSYLRLIIGFLLISGPVLALPAGSDDEEYLEEMIVYFSVPRIGGADIAAVLGDSDIYLSILDIFDFLKIKNSSTPGFDRIHGFFITEDAPYEIDRVHLKITYKDKEYTLKPTDLIRSETGLYLKIEYFGQIFDLDCNFNFRSLSVTMNTSIELPVIREMRQEQMRKSLGRFRGKSLPIQPFVGNIHSFILGWQIGMSS